jgi:hypothetical protein
VRRFLAPVAGLLVILYVVLGVLASVCLFSHGVTQAGEHHHHSDQTAHSTLCLWACQAVSDSSLLSTAPGPQALTASIGSLLTVFSLTPRQTLDRLRSRAPPRSYHLPLP